MPRAAREISESGRYHIMLRGINKQNIFENDEDKEKYMSILTEYKEKCGFEILCIIERILKESRNKE